MSLYFTPRELSNRFQVSERMVTHLARIGIFPGIKVGHLWRFKITEIEVWERQQGCSQGEIDALVNEILKEPGKGKKVNTESRYSQKASRFGEWKGYRTVK